MKNVRAVRRDVRHSAGQPRPGAAPVVCRRVEMHISYACSQSCIFCSEYLQMRRFSGQFMSREDISTLLDGLRRYGLRHVSFTGGEPSLHPELPALLRRAKEIGYTTYVTTNGGLFEDKAFCREVFPWLDEICVSLHGPTRQVHERHTRTPGSFDRACRVMENVASSRVRPEGFVNMVLTPYNRARVGETLRLPARFPVFHRVLLSAVAPEGRARCVRDPLVVPLSYIRANAGRWSLCAARLGLQLRFFGVPVCVLGAFKENANDLWWDPRLTIEKGRTPRGKAVLRSTVSLTPDRNRVKILRCRSCCVSRRCGGAFRRHLEGGGRHEIRPL